MRRESSLRARVETAFVGSAMGGVLKAESDWLEARMLEAKWLEPR